jgi:hypothetical protein
MGDMEICLAKTSIASPGWLLAPKPGVEEQSSNKRGLGEG